MRQKGTPDPGQILKSKKCCDAQQLPNGFRSDVGIGGHSIGWATSATCTFRSRDWNVILKTRRKVVTIVLAWSVRPDTSFHRPADIVTCPSCTGRLLERPPATGRCLYL